MKKLLFLLFVFHTTLILADDAQSAMGVVQRRVPGIASNVSFVSIADSLGYDVFEVSASGGQLTVKGSSAVAMCHGLYDYLKKDCKCQVTWEGDQLALPNPLPTVPSRRVVSSVLYKQYFNVVTFGYSTAFWDWARWEKEIDWMALHGINMPLAMNGQEKIWQQIWKGYGCTDMHLNAFFTGPAFLAWNRMGNVYGKEGCLSMVNGSLPQSFIDNDALLQKKILAREVELGMKPIIPGFSGFIPRAMKTLYPNINTWVPTAWNGATPSTLALHPLDTMFATVTKNFIKLYKSYYGDVTNFYLIDLFNEIDPPAGTTTTDLSTIAKATYNSLINADNKAMWVIQGWCFYYQSYWKNTTNTSAYLDSVPNNRMIVLDLNADASEVFRSQPAVAKKYFIWDMLGNNWGQHTQLSGNLDVLAAKPIKALKDANATELHMVGMGMSDEGIEHNSVCFELMTDNMWRKTSVDLPSWIAAWAQQRYGSTDAVVSQIWTKMYTLFYKNANDPIAPYQQIPTLSSLEKGVNNQDIRMLLNLMLTAPQTVQQNGLFQRDLVDVAKRYVGDNIQTSIWKVVTGIQTADAKTKAYRAEFDSLMLGLDALLGTQVSHRMDNWIKGARSTVADADKNLLEQNARLQVTTWVAPSWQGYARKEWSGIVGDYYRGKWNNFFDAVAAGGFNQSTFNTSIYNWSNAWASKTTLYPTYACQPVAQTKYLMMLCDRLNSSAVTSAPSDSLGLAYNMPVTASSYENNSSSYAPSNITNGSTTGNFWSATPYPQYAIIDMQVAYQVAKLRVYPYFDGIRYYQYKIEGSADGTNWFMMADMTTNTKVGSAVGFTHLVNNLSARYIKITMTKNSANTGVHLYELRVFGPDNLPINHQPIIADSTVSIPRKSNTGTLVAKIPVTDPDAGQFITYSITDASPLNAFVLKNDSLIVKDLTLVNPLDNKAFVYLKVADSGQPYLVNYARYTIQLNDIQTAISPNGSGCSVKVFPNPAKNNIYVEGEKGIVLCGIIDVVGKSYPVVVNNSTVSNRFSVDISRLVPGMYLLELKDKNNQRFAVHFAKNNL